MQNTPKGLRLHIGIFGRRNAGKSSLLNAVVRQNAALVSDRPGTTTDPVDKAMELPPLGPVVFIDTAGIDDDESGIGALRVERTVKVMDRCDAALLVCRASDPWGEPENRLIRDFLEKKVPFAVVFSQIDRDPVSGERKREMKEKGYPFVCVSARTGEGLFDLRECLVGLAPEQACAPDRMLGDLLQPFRPVLLITPVDKAAPKGRLILPQVQAIRDALDADAWCVAAKENAVEAVLRELKNPPVLAVTDSQAFGTVSKQIPDSIPLTSFSILLARLKSDLETCAAGAASIPFLRNGSRILIAEACSHPPVEEDIGKVKIPAWLRKKTGKELEIRHVQGQDFPEDPSGFDLVIHCGACMFNRKAVLSRMMACEKHHVPFTNYGVCIAELHGILERALAPFPRAVEAYRRAAGTGRQAGSDQ